MICPNCRNHYSNRGVHRANWCRNADRASRRRFAMVVAFSTFEDLVAKNKTGSVKTMITAARIKIG
jgi:hypothetical protein